MEVNININLSLALPRQWNNLMDAIHDYVWEEEQEDE